MLTSQELEENLQKIKEQSEKIKIKENLERLDNDLGNQKLAGLETDPQVIEALKEVARGEKKIDDVKRDLFQQNLKRLYDLTMRPNLVSFKKNIVTVDLHSMTYTPVTGYFDFDHLKNIHRRCFRSIDKEAGEVRQTDLEKEGTHFVSPTLIERNNGDISSCKRAGKEIFDQLRQEGYLQGLNADDFSQRAGAYLGAINKLHPFQDGNGRTQRAFLSTLAAYNNYSISWKEMSQKDMDEASLHAMKGDSKALSSLLRSHLIEKDREAFVRDLSKDIHEGIKIKEVKRDPKIYYQGLVVAQTEDFILQQQREHPETIVLHPRLHLQKEDYQDWDGNIEYPESQESHLIKGSVKGRDYDALYFENVVQPYLEDPYSDYNYHRYDVSSPEEFEEEYER